MCNLIIAPDDISAQSELTRIYFTYEMFSFRKSTIFGLHLQIDVNLFMFSLHIYKQTQ